MNIGQEFICNICKAVPVGNYHRYTCNYASIDMKFYACSGLCDKKFRNEYVEPFEPITSRFDILDIRE